MLRKEGLKMSEAVELYTKDGKAMGVFYCSECEQVFTNRDQAQNCHGERLCECGEKADRYCQQCQKCTYAKFLKQQAEKEAERFEKATKIKSKEQNSDMVFFSDKYYHDIQEVIDDYADGNAPKYVWPCKTVGVPFVDLEDVTCYLLNNMWGDADVSDLNGVVELEAALEAFNEANESIKIWEPDYSTAILIGR